jgi:hypothetical protein
MATRRTGKPYIYVTWLAKLLGGQQCLWSAWFKAHFKYEKFEEQALDLVQWNREHSELMAARQRELEAQGWTVTTEEQNSFKLEGAAAVVAGKPDIIATKPGQVLVVDGTTGRMRDSDVWQLLFFLFAVQKARPDLKGDLVGEVQYKSDDCYTFAAADLTPEHLKYIVSLIKVISSDTAPARVPSRDECKRCNIGVADCPQRVTEQRTTTLVGEF